MTMKKITKTTKTVEKKVKKAKVDPNKTYVYYVVDFLFWQVMVFRYELVKKTSKMAVVLDSNGKPKRLTLEDPSGKVCDTPKEARKYAKAKLKERKLKLKEYKEKLKKSEKEIEEGLVRIVDPLSMKKIKAEHYVF